MRRRPCPCRPPPLSLGHHRLRAAGPRPHRARRSSCEPRRTWIVLLAALLAAAVLIAELVTDARLFIALAKAGMAAGGAMVIGATALRIWAGAIVTGAQLPAGAGLEFDERAEDLADLEDALSRLDAQTDRRLNALERAVFDQNGDPPWGSIR
jgi:hypothetical protein